MGARAGSAALAACVKPYLAFCMGCCALILRPLGFAAQRFQLLSGRMAIKHAPIQIPKSVACRAALLIHLLH